MEAKSHAIKIDYIKANIRNTQHNRKRMLCEVKDETMNHIIHECRKLKEKLYNTKHY